jgi:hypothetical protein
MVIETLSLIGSSALACVERSTCNSDGMRRAKRVVRVEPPRAKDAIPEGMCRRCGLVGFHGKDPDNCITALHDEMARLAFRADRDEPEKPRRGRPPKRWV